MDTHEYVCDPSSVLLAYSNMELVQHTITYLSMLIGDRHGEGAMLSKRNCASGTENDVG